MGAGLRRALSHGEPPAPPPPCQDGELSRRAEWRRPPACSFPLPASHAGNDGEAPALDSTEQRECQEEELRGDQGVG